MRPFSKWMAIYVLLACGWLIPAKTSAQSNAELLRDPQIENLLTRQGYERIRIRRVDGQLRITACADKRVHRISVLANGSVRSFRTEKKCPETALPRQRQALFQPEEIEPMLRREGFKRIAVVRDDRYPYIARACRGRDRVELTIGRRGQIRQQQRIDNCRVRIDKDNLENIVREKGYDSVNVVRRQNTPYMVDGCKNGDFTRLYIDKYGKIERRKRLGRCAPRLSRKEIRRSLASRNLKIVSIDREKEGWRADVCDGNRRVALLIGFRGGVLRENGIGDCRPENVLNILETLEERGANSVNAYVEGCFDGGRYRWSYDRLGKRTGRERIGDC